MTLPSHHEEAIELYKAGLSVQAIESRTGVKSSNLYKILDKAGVKRRGYGPRDKSLRAIEAYEAVRRGEKQSEIARRYGVSRQRVHQLIRKAEEWSKA